MMKKIALLFLLIFSVVKIQSQNIQIAFAATGANSAVDSVRAENLTRCSVITLGGNDILQLKETVGIIEMNSGSDQSLHIYPNPMAGFCSADFEATGQGLATIGLYDITGKRILQVRDLLAKGHHTYKLNGINSGLYFLQVESDKYFYSAKIACNNLSAGKAEIKYTGTTPGINKQSPVSGTGNTGYLKSAQSIINIQYSPGDILKLKGYSGGIYSTVFMLIPTQSQTVTFNFVSCTDADNNHYAVVQIGTQIWMAENLKTTKYSNDVAIPGITDNTQWSTLTTGAYSDVNNIPGNTVIYGKLYNFYSVEDSRNICPKGWHVPSDAELTTLTTFLGSENNAGGLLKEKCTTFWQSPNTGATNSSGFSALPGGYRDNNDGAFYSTGTNGFYWSVTASGSSYAWYRLMYNNSALLMRRDFHKKGGLSVRCLRDAGGSTSTPTITTTAVSGTTQTSTTTGGNVTNDGGASISARGVCWGTSPNPTTANSKTTDGSGTGVFVSNLTGLTPNTPYYARAYATNSKGTGYGNEVTFTTLAISGFTCGSTITVNHVVSGGVAPVAKTVIYGTVMNIPGEPAKCWITSNLGASQQSTAANDATEASAGWYWQFNRKQGYRHDGTTRTPNISWVGSFSEISDWLPANDPCTIELGASWHIPTSAEWTNVDAAGNWTSWNGPWNSGLKLHAAGYLRAIDGVLFDRGVFGASWSNMQETNIWGRYLNFNSGECYPYRNAKYYGFPVRCIRDTGGSTSTPTVTTTAVTGTTQTSTTTGGNVTNDGGAAVTARGVCWSTSPNPTTANSKTTDGTGTGTFVSSITGLSSNTPYYVRAYATNSVGTGYGNEVNFTTLAGFTCGSTITINHVVSGGVAPVTKTATYGTVMNIPGEPTKCWITSNLGASRQATAVNDATETSAGWYWQFNRKQGYKHDGSTRTPNTTWISSISESSDWTAANDPCTIELGSGWHIPTSVEWTNVDATSGWTNWNGPWNSGLKLHAAGYLETDGLFYNRGVYGHYWSNTQNNAASASNMYLYNTLSEMVLNNKPYGFSLRCIKDTINPDNVKVGKIYEGAKAIETAFLSGDVNNITNVLTDDAKGLYGADLLQIKKIYFIKFGEAFKTRELRVFSDIYAEFNYTKDGVVFTVSMARQEDDTWKLMRL